VACTFCFSFVIVQEIHQKMAYAWGKTGFVGACICEVQGKSVVVLYAREGKTYKYNRTRLCHSGGDLT
jgi:hypothetical protein